MREFTLHDGGGEDKTEELHKFLEGYEWEGDEGGVYIILRSQVGDRIIIEDSGAVRIQKKLGEEDGGGDPTTDELLKPRGNNGIVSSDICYDALLIVGGVQITEQCVRGWTQDQLDRAYNWAIRCHLKASDNEDVFVLPMPEYIESLIRP